MQNKFQRELVKLANSCKTRDEKVSVWTEALERLTSKKIELENSIKELRSKLDEAENKWKEEAKSKGILDRIVFYNDVAFADENKQIIHQLSLANRDLKKCNKNIEFAREWLSYAENCRVDEKDDNTKTKKR